MIQERDDHPTASDIFEAAAPVLPGIGYATVYNSLRYLKDAGLVYEINLVIAPAATTAKPIVTTTPSATIAASWSISICRTPPISCMQRRAVAPQPQSVHLTLGTLSWIVVEEQITKLSNNNLLGGYMTAATAAAIEKAQVGQPAPDFEMASTKEHRETERAHTALRLQG